MAKNKEYFTIDTENAIIRYNKEENPLKKSKIYEQQIHYPFFKLTENLIHTFKFYHTEVDDLEHLQHETIVFLLSKIHLYDHVKNINDKITKICKSFDVEYNYSFDDFVGDIDRVSKEQINDFITFLNIGNEECLKELTKIYPPKAYSYFGTIAKNYLIIYNDKNYKKKINSSPIESIYDDDKFSYDIESTSSNLNYFLTHFTSFIDNNLLSLFPKEKDRKIASAIIEVIKNRKNLKIFQKKVVYFYIKEIIPDVKTPKITKISNVIYKHFKKHYTFYLENGYIDFLTD